MTSGDNHFLSANFDCVVMLTLSDWRMKSPFHHFSYATRFAKNLPVIFVQPDLKDASFKYENTETDGIDVLHVYQTYGPQQRNLLNKALLERRYLKPLLWISNPLISDFVIHHYAPLKIFYAFEDYFAPDFVADRRRSEYVTTLLQRIVSHCSLVIAPSPSTIEHCVHRTGYTGEGVILKDRDEPSISNPETHEHDNDSNFELIVNKIRSTITTENHQQDPLNILVLYDDQSTHINTVKEFLDSFSMFSRSGISYAFATHNSQCLMDLSAFDVVVIHYSIRLCYDWHLSPSYAEALKQFGGYKVLYIQDEYDHTETARKWMEVLGIHTVFTCVPQKYVERVYPSFRFPHTEFITVLTGYISPALENYQPKQLSERKFLIGYRGRKLAYFYGDLAREKTIIAQKMREFCESRNLLVNIEWDESKRIYGDGWYDFVGDCRATLGTESGANVFDEVGDIRHNVEKALAENPNITYQEIHERYLAEHDGRVKMNQISPRVFEAIALRTALVLFEGEYSGIVKPDLHYIPLKKDFSNVDEVLHKLQDDNYLEQLTEQAYKDIIGPGKYTYRKFIHDFDQFLAQCRVRKAEVSYITAIIAGLESATGTTELVKFSPNVMPQPRYSFFTSQPLQKEQTVAFGPIVGAHSTITTTTTLVGIETVPITISVLDNSRVKTLAKRGVKIVDSVYVRMYSALHKGRTITGGEDISITRNRAFITMANLVLRILNFFYAKSIRY